MPQNLLICAYLAGKCFALAAILRTAESDQVCDKISPNDKFNFSYDPKTLEPPLDPLHRIQDLEHIKTLTDARRLAILRLLIAEPLTLSQLGLKLGEHPAKIRHHLKKLEDAGFIIVTCELNRSQNLLALDATINGAGSR